MNPTRRIFSALALITLGACARSSTSTPAREAGGAPAASTAKRNPDVITQDELLDPAIVSLDLASAIRRLRPSFFRSSGPQSFSNADAGTVHYSHDFGPLQPISQLAGMNSMSIVEIRYLNANEAANRFGLNANGGPVIVLLSNKQVP